jgi:hypothetical protein
MARELRSPSGKTSPSDLLDGGWGHWLPRRRTKVHISSASIGRRGLPLTIQSGSSGRGKRGDRRIRIRSYIVAKRKAVSWFRTPLCGLPSTGRQGAPPRFSSRWACQFLPRSGCCWSASRPKVLPFDIKVPNAEAQAAISELEQGAGRPFGSVDDLKANLNTKD